MRLYFIALQFLTIIPLPFQVRWDERALGRSMALFPLVGLSLGGLLVGVDVIFARVLPRPLLDIMLVALLAVATGALHLDGLADVCDAMAARGSRERFLAVMKDSRIGAVGAVGLVLGLMIKYQAILQIPPESKRMMLLFFPAVSRFGQVLMTVGAKRARQDGLGVVFISGVGRGQLAVALLITMASGFLTLGWQGVSAVAFVSLLTLSCRRYFTNRVGGITGDLIGCVSEINEMGCLVFLLALSGIKF